MAPPCTTEAYMEKKQGRTGGRLFFLPACIMIASFLIAGCSHVSEELRAGFREANDLFLQERYSASLARYEKIIAQYPAAGDRVLFEMGILHAYPGNDGKDYEKALECFQKLLRDYPESAYRKESGLMIFQIRNAFMKDEIIAAQQAQIVALRQEADRRGADVLAMRDRTEALAREAALREQEVSALRKEVFVLQKGPVDRILIEKKARSLSLIAKGRVLKTYRIALGGNPDGPKERQGDNRTPEGTYTIDGRNRNSGYHLSLRISYPNERDRRRARELGVSPGGDIMIHGIKNGLSWAGEHHAGIDWTKGCIAVTDEEIEEIERLAPDGTVVEIRP